MLKSRGESMVQRLGECPLPIRINIPVNLSGDQIKSLDLNSVQGKPIVFIEKAGYPKDQRDYTVAADILKNLGIKSMQLITNNPDKLHQMQALGVRVVGRIPCEIKPINEIVKNDLRAKRERDALRS